MTLNGTISVYPFFQDILSGLTVGSDGNLWFSAADSIASITPSSGTFREFALPPSYYGAFGPLTTGPDGNLWFSNDAYPASPAIGRITPSGTVSEFPEPSVFADGTLTAAPDGNLWFLAEIDVNGVFGGGVGRITPAGVLTVLPAPSIAEGEQLTVGPDNNLYFTVPTYADLPRVGAVFAGARIGRISPSGVVVEIQPASAQSSPQFDGNASPPTVGPDGNLWFPDGTSIGRLDLGQVTPDEFVPPGVSFRMVNHTGEAITSIVVAFDQPMVPSSAETVGFYKLASGFSVGHKFVVKKSLKIASATYNNIADTITLDLARPFKGKVQLTVHAGVMATNGTSTRGNFTAVVS
jgi:streptogramin lyase